MRRVIGFSIFVIALFALFACDSSGSRREKMGAAGSADELRDSTRLDSSVDARNRAGGTPSTAHDTI
jgi:hypothetical protein